MTIKATPVSLSRRDLNNIVIQDNNVSSDDFDDFFEFEKEFAGMDSARKLARVDEIEINEEIIKKQNFTIMEEVDLSIIEKTTPIEFEVLREDEVIATATLPKKKEIEFIQCKYMKDDKQQCRRQAPKGGDYCSNHRKLMEKEISLKK